MEKLPEFAYRSPLERGQIRLLFIESRKRGHIRTCLKTVHLEDFKYYALSYQWGPVEPSRQIFVDGAPFRIRENLWNFLNAANTFPIDGHSCGIWTDAICINQQDTVEKSQQVQLMGKIYENASRVLVWLGLSAIDSEALIRLYDIFDGDYPYLNLTQFKHLMDRKKTESEAKEVEAVLLKYARDGWHTQTSLYDKCLSAFWQWKSVLDRDPGIRSALTAVASSSYWTRAWILQEIFLGQRTVIPCPGRLIDLEPILAVLQHVDKYSLLEETSADFAIRSGSYKDVSGHLMERATIHTQTTRAKEEAYSRRILHDRLSDECRVPLESLLSLPSNQIKSYSTFAKAIDLSLIRECSIPKDRIYSVVALAGGDGSFPVDYNDEPEKVFAKVINFAWQWLKVNDMKDSPDCTLIDYLEITIRRAFEALDLRPPPHPSTLQLEDILSASQSLEFHFREKFHWYQRSINTNREVEFGIVAQLPCSNLIVAWPARESSGTYSLDTLRRHILPAGGAASVSAFDDETVFDVFDENVLS